MPGGILVVGARRVKKKTEYKKEKTEPSKMQHLLRKRKKQDREKGLDRTGKTACKVLGHQKKKKETTLWYHQARGRRSKRFATFERNGNEGDREATTGEEKRYMPRNNGQGKLGYSNAGKKVDMVQKHFRD